MNMLAEDFVRTSAFLLREYRGLHTAGASRTIFVFDSDIILTACAPWMTGPRQGSRNGLGDIFAVSSQEPLEVDLEKARKNAMNVASILSRHALGVSERLEGGGRLPIFQLPSHLEETNRIFRSMRWRVERFEKIDRRHSRLRRDFELTRLLAVLRSQISALGDSHGTMDHVLDRVADLLTSRFEGETELNQILKAWDSYYELETARGGIYSLEDAVSFFDAPPDVARAFGSVKHADRTPYERRLHETLYEHWFEQLAPFRRGENLATDAAALSDLFLVDLRLFDSAYRCVFITGDRRLVENTYGGLSQRLLRVRGDGEEQTVARCHRLVEAKTANQVRHFWAYSVEALIEPVERPQMIDLFGGLLASWSTPLGLQSHDLEKLVRTRNPKINVSDTEIRHLLGTWENLTKIAIGQSTLEEQNARTKEVIRDALLSRPEISDWDHLIRMLREDVARVLDRTVLAMSDLGIDQVIRAHQIGRRNPPELVFDSLPHTNALIRLFAVAKIDVSAELFGARYAKIGKDCYDSSADGDDRQESYLKFIVLGAAFASAEKWAIAQSHARRAIAIVDRSRETSSPIPVKDPSKTNMSGREAYFLAAVAQRILAQEFEDFHTALGFLANAERALARDHRKGTASKIRSFRFDNERFATHLGKYYLTRSMDDTDPCDQEVAEVYKAALSVIGDFGRRTVGGRPDSTERVTVAATAVNLIQTYVISEFRARNTGRQNRRPSAGLKSPVTTALVLLSLRVLEAETDWRKKEGDETKATPLIRAYASMGQLLTCEPHQRRKACNQLSEILAEPEKIIVTVYDPWRFKALEDFALRFATGTEL